MNLNSEEKCFIYAWLKSLLSHELTACQLTSYQTGEFDSLFDFLSEQGFEESIKQIRSELLQLKQIPLAHLELAADFAQLFLLHGNSSALPYASAYLDEHTMASHLVFMDNLLDEFHLQLNCQMHEPSDHLAVHLELLIQLEKNDETNRTFDFIHNYCLIWLKPFNQKVQGIQTKTKFYQKITELLVNILIGQNTSV